MIDFNILTFHTALNHGAALQAIGLQAFLRQLGYSASIFDYQPPRVGSGTGIRGKAVSMLRKLHPAEYDQKEAAFQSFRARYMTLSLDKQCHVFLSGSDQVWNPSGAMNPVFFQQYVGPDCLHASYAASMGNTNIPPLHRELFEKYINSFDVISVREQEVKNVLSEFCRKPINVHVDPVLLHSADFWRAYASPVDGLPEKYTLVYLLHLPKNVNSLLIWLKKQTGDPIVLIDGQGIMTCVVRHDRAIHFAGPAEFLWLMDHASRIVTSSFHGTAFSLVFEKEFYSIVNPKTPSRISHLLSLVGMQPIQESEKAFVRNTAIDWQPVRQQLKMEAAASAEYLRSVYEASLHLHREPITGTVEQLSQPCTGCSACASACPTNAISMKLNEEGFYQPVIQQELCIHCGKCRRICPQEQILGQERVASWYGWHKNPSVVSNSSSGGVMRALADLILAEGGVVFGADFTEDYRAVEFRSTDEVDIARLQKSKYTVSRVGTSFADVEKQLQNGRSVLFCGSPCQCAGLKSFLGRDYDRLLTCDFICGGFSSLRFYREHLDYLEKKYGSRIVFVDFRPKDKGWGKQRFKVHFSNGKELLTRSHNDSYFMSFANKHISVRDTCLQCRYTGAHAADITLADFWGYKAANIKKHSPGMSLVVANSQRGVDAISRAEELCLYPLDLKYSDYAFRYRGPQLAKLQERNRFFSEALRLDSFEQAFSASYSLGEAAHLLAALKSKLHLK